MGWWNGGMWNRGTDAGWWGGGGAETNAGRKWMRDFFPLTGLETHQMSWNQLELPREGDQPLSGRRGGFEEDQHSTAAVPSASSSSSACSHTTRSNGGHQALS
jgi:hypothetical protein